MLKSLLILPILLASMSSFANSTDEVKLDDWMFNPLSRFVTEKEWNKITDDMHDERVKKEKQARMFGEGKIITVDTRNQVECKSLQATLIRNTAAPVDQLESICIQNEEKPFTSFVVVGDQYRTPISFNNLSERQKKLAKQTRNFTALGAAAIGLLWVMPESVTKWDKEEISGAGLGNKWKENVKEGPVVDKDDWMINYIGHPISGAAYYTVARHAGFNKMESFGYSVVMSTFFWEYGFEAFAETPSIQDLLITPIIGSLMGEAMFTMEQKIKDNGGKLFGSEKVGGFAMALMNPAGAMLDGINGFFENDIIKSSRTYLYTQGSTTHQFGSSEVEIQDSVIGIGIELKF
ncbi:DUF3943 domain-containing protein [Halobacteriovorax sp. JY17]|uniref:DUF3943 domain-containing protein n=1 Tax=Halobacteriovorax sp. JY17 TaxID=2014617 RepID=UPI000C6850B0|nr:DUF3943 domain-containing protein [Halobacteriovorax sp. JY17]PIK16704.1 MAG: hypothetical protein CES88_08140 [Halobacteriovorax sp. JY17]